MYRLSALDRKLLPTIEQAQRAIRAADRAVKPDTRDLMSILMRIVEANGLIRNAERIRRVGVTSFSWQIVAADEKDNERAAAAKARCTHAINRILRYHTDTPLYGALAIELAWQQTAQGKAPRIARRYRPVEVLRADDPGAIQIMPDGDIKLQRPIAEAERQGWILDSDESNGPGGILRSLIFSEIVCNDMRLEWANYNKKVKGQVLAQYTEGATDEEKAAALESLKSIVQNNYTLASKDIEYGFNQIVSHIGATSFEGIIKNLRAYAEVTILGQENATSVPDNSGSRAALEVLRLISADILWEDMIRCEQMINEQLLTYDFQLAHSPGAAGAPWTFSFVTPEELTVEARAAAIETILRSGVPLQSQEVYNTLGYTRPEGVPDTLGGTPETALAGGAV